MRAKRAKRKLARANAKRAAELVKKTIKSIEHHEELLVEAKKRGEGKRNRRPASKKNRATKKDNAPAVAGKVAAAPSFRHEQFAVGNAIRKTCHALPHGDGKAHLPVGPQIQGPRGRGTQPRPKHCLINDTGGVPCLVAINRA